MQGTGTGIWFVHVSRWKRIGKDGVALSFLGDLGLDRVPFPVIAIRSIARRGALLRVLLEFAQT